MQLPNGVQVPFNKEINLVAHPLMGGYLINEPFGVIWIFLVVKCLGILLWEEPIVTGLMLSQEIDMEGWVNSSIFEPLRQL